MVPCENQNENGGVVFAAERILDSRVVKQSKKSKGKAPTETRQYLIRWRGFSSAHDTWEPAENVLSPSL